MPLPSLPAPTTCAAPRRMLVTSALPYANGPLHLGHMLEAIQTDIWVRALRMQGHQVIYISAEDTHGTPVMLRAQKEGIRCSALIERSQAEHKHDFDCFGIALDYYDSTNTVENRRLCEQTYSALVDAGLIEARAVEQAYDPVREMFLPDRFIKGACPKCGAPDQYGDACEACGSIYQPTELINPYSILSGAAPERRTSTHYFFRLTDARCIAFLRKWIEQLAQPEASNKIREWLAAEKAKGEIRIETKGEGQGKPKREGQTEEGGSAVKLADWDISRDAPYFGFEIPAAPGKYFYVWLDAPLGYYASFKNFCRARGLDFDDWVKPGSATEQYHFIGKDILYFHTLFWPAMLKFAGYRTPTNIFVHGFLTIDGQKMSKSRGTFISARHYLDVGMNPEWLRYYFAAKLNRSIEDIDLKFDDFIARVNGELIGKYINIASRCAGFLVKYFDGRVQAEALHHPLLARLRAVLPAIAAHYEARDYARAVRAAMHEADAVNAYIEAAKPWRQAKDIAHEASKTALHATCSIGMEAFRLLTLALKPVLPQLAAAVEDFLALEPLAWSHAAAPLRSDRPIKAYRHLMTRIQAQQVEQLAAQGMAARAAPDRDSARAAI